MHITLVDDSITFDGYSPQSRPLGGAEKAFARLASALARRGHDVHAFNRAAYPMLIEGVQWETFEGKMPSKTDALVAFRKPSLLPFVRMVGKRVLWVTATARQLEPARAAIESYRPTLVLLGRRHALDFAKPGDKSISVVAPGIGPDFLDDRPTEPADAPTAIVTTHPLHHLDWLLTRWTEAIRPSVPNARLLVVSAALAKGANGGEVPETMRPVLAQAMAARDLGVEILPPRSDPGMAELYRQARVMLYPGHADDMACWTLMEAQAAGLPAVARDLGAAAERIQDGRTGNIAPDDEAFANLAGLLLTNDDVFWTMNRDSRLLQRERGWDQAAAQFESVLKGY